MKLKINIVCFALFLILQGCMTTIVDKTKEIQNLEYLNQPTVENIDLDYEIECKAKIVNGKLNHSGKCGIIITKHNQLKFSLYHPMGGAIIISFMDEKKIQYLNREEKIFYQMENTSEHRKDIFLKVVDLNIADFKEIFWGRKIKSLNNNIEFVKNNQSVKAFKKGKLSVEIIYHKWQSVYGIQLPKLITIKSVSDGAYIKIAVTKSIIGEIKRDKEMSLLKNCAINF